MHGLVQAHVDKDNPQNPASNHTNQFLAEQARNECGPFLHGFAPRIFPLLRSPTSTGDPFAAHSVIPPTYTERRSCGTPASFNVSAANSLSSQFPPVQ